MNPVTLLRVVGIARTALTLLPTIAPDSDIAKRVQSIGFFALTLLENAKDVDEAMIAKLEAIQLEITEIETRGVSLEDVKDERENLANISGRMQALAEEAERRNSA